MMCELALLTRLSKAAFSSTQRARSRLLVRISRRSISSFASALSPCESRRGEEGWRDGVRPRAGPREKGPGKKQALRCCT